MESTPGGEVRRRRDRQTADIRAAYRARGYELALPEDVSRLGRTELHRVSGQVVGLLAQVYGRAPETLADEARRLADAVGDGRVRLLVLLDDRGAVTATTRFTRIEPLFPGAEGGRHEVGRTGKRPGAEPRLAAGLLRARLLWAVDHLGRAGHVVSHTRVARAAPGRPPVGPLLAGLLAQDGCVPTHAGYSHIVARTAAEPFVSTCLPLDRAAWRTAVRAQRIRLPDHPAQRLFGAMLAETCGVEPRYAPAPEPPAGAPLLTGHLRELAAADPAVESRYLLSRRPALTGRPVDAVPYVVGPDGTHRSTGLSDRIVVEQDIVDGGGALPAIEYLRRQGFEPAGWEPSHQHHARAALVLTRPGTLPAPEVSVAAPDLSSLAGLPATQRFLAHVLARRPAAAVTARG
ncbi:hypothetical protein [Kitasatospora sp. NPDC057015]|uniref:hypothetical protein n=1 Tax=Kitasatospora sp. NPDC057015 TaxID=3346001 RepID=UPI00363B6BB4